MNELDKLLKENDPFIISEVSQLMNSTVGVTPGYTISKMKLVKLVDLIPTYFKEHKDLANIVKSISEWKHDDSCDYTSEFLSNDRPKKIWYNYYKSRTPAFTLTSYAEETSLAKEIKNPYIIIDIDDIEVTDDLFEELNSIPFVLATGKSFSGKGLYSIVKFDMNEINESNFTQLFEELAYYYDFEKDIIIDRACKNINRLRVLSPYDLIINLDFKGEYHLTNIKKKEDEKIYDTNEDSLKYSGTDITRVKNEYVFIKDSTGKYNREVPLPPYMKDYVNPGHRYELLWRYADAIYKYMRNDGYEVFIQYFPDNYRDEKESLDSIWKSAKNRGAELNVSNFVKEELLRQGLIKPNENPFWYFM